MIQPNEKLLPGNIVTYHGETDIDCVLDVEDIYNISTGHRENNKIHSPIKLTKEWLIKFGFTKDEQGWYFKRVGQTTLSINIKRKQTVLSSKKAVLEAWNVDIKFTEFVHQLQNTYPILGEELVV